jgi:hypothetical protein
LFNEINARGLSGNLIVNIIDATVAETGAVALNPVAASGCSAGPHTILIKPDAGVAATLSGSAASLIKLNGADYVIFDGLNTGGSSLTFSNTSTATSTSVIWIGSVGAGAGATNDTIRNCTIQNGTVGSNTITNFGIFVGQTSGAANGEDNDNVAIQNNIIRRATIGIQAIGGTTAGQQNDNLFIDNNTIGDATVANSIGRIGMNVGQATGATVSRNTVFNVVTSDAGINANSNSRGIIISTGTTNSVVTRNNVNGIRYTNTSGYGGKGIDINTGSATSNLTVSNNFVSDITGDGWSDVTTDGIAGIRILGTTGGVNLYNNSVNLGSGTFAGNTSGTRSAALAIGASVTALDIRNNILSTNLVNSNASGARSYSVFNAATTNAGMATINYNDYAPSGTQGVIGSLNAVDATTLAAWQTATAQDANSLNVAPVFVSATDLHLVTASNCSLHRKGTPIAGITVDIDGDTRNTTYPDMGADEYSLNVTGTMTWTGAVNTDWFNVGNWNICEIPGPTSDVIINGSLPNYPNVTNNVTIKSLTTNPGSSINFATGINFILLGM